MLAALQTLDYQIIRRAAEITASDRALSVLVYFCAEWLIFAFPVVLAVLWEDSKRSKRIPRSKKAVVMAIMSIALTLTAKTLFSFIFSRTRPFITHPDILAMKFHVDVVSFPSGHTMIACAMAASLYLSGYKRLGSWLMAVALVIGISRILAGVHYPTDIIGGIVFGLASAIYLHREASSLKNYLPDD